VDRLGAEAGEFGVNFGDYRQHGETCMTIHFIHGILTIPTSPVDGILPYLRATGHQVAFPDYGYELALDVRHVNPMIVGALLPYIQPGDILVGHSNGCAIASDLIQRGAPADHLVLINGALNSDIGFPASVKRVDVYWNAGDTITEAAKIGAELGLVDPSWGEIGHQGYMGNDQRVTNFNCGETVGMPVVSGHSDFFSPLKLAQWGPFLAQRLQKSPPLD
jgi:pimeloyl-ACP methyl ester carboxylesterase